MLYPLSLLVLSGLVALLERLWPWRPAQRQLRPFLWSDLLHLVFNGHFLGLLLYGIAVHRVLPWVDGGLDGAGMLGVVYRDTAAGWPLWQQVVVALVVVDLLQWCVHNCLHRVPVLWEWHKVHHSVRDGEMDWVVSFRFQWTEVVLYKALLYLPLAWFGFAEKALLFHAVFGTLIGHLNHANLDLDWGVGRYVLNSPRMHIWHHDYDAEPPAYNFGIIFSAWDWIFGTAHLPDHPPRRIGYVGVEQMPRDFFAQEAWQLSRWVPALRRTPALVSLAGVGVLATGWVLHQPRTVPTPLLGEQAAASQPAGAARSPVVHAATPAAAAEALDRFGERARASGWAHPEWTVGAAELAEALSAERLVLLDVRPAERVEAGRIPSAQPVDRSDYSHKDPAPGVSVDAAALQALLRSRGVDEGDVVVVYGDGGPEPYRLWWTLRVVAGVEVRVLDGGLAAWKALGERLAGGPPLAVEPGTVRVRPQSTRRALLWEDLAGLQAERPGMVWVDTRSEVEFLGTQQHRKAARAGHIPGAVHLDWTRVLRSKDADPRLRPLDELEALLAPLRSEDGVVTYCQSGTRSSTLYFAMLQLGWDEHNLWNYDGSWAEYSRLASLPVETGPGRGALQ